jgi:NTP pyrophosphatase (non-canonical NTP hydrolase)
MSLNKLAAECHATNQHWWHDPATGERLDRNRGELFMLMVSEIAEAMEGERKDLMDDKLPHRKMAEVELADTMIRIMDYAGAVDLDLDAATLTTTFMPDFPANKGEALLQIVGPLHWAGNAISQTFIEREIARAVQLIQRYARMHGYDLDGAIAEKRAYNATRADHKAEARLAAGGKKW